MHTWHGHACVCVCGGAYICDVIESGEDVPGNGGMHEECKQAVGILL